MQIAYSPSTLLVSLGHPPRAGRIWRPCSPSTSSVALSPASLQAATGIAFAARTAPHQRKPQRFHPVRAGPGAPVTDKWWQKNNPPNMKSVANVQEFVDSMAEAQDKLVVVEFYAKWCHSCRSLFPKVCSLLGSDPDVVVIKVDWDDNKDICKALGIKVLPFFQFYRGQTGRVAGFAVSVTKVQRLRDALQAFSGPSRDKAPLPLLPEFPDTLPSHSIARLGQAANNVVVHHKPGQASHGVQERVLQGVS